jgi:hypothetical protein
MRMAQKYIYKLKRNKMKKLLLVVLVSLGLQTQAQQPAPYFCCDSITYWTDQGQGLSVGLDTSGIIHDADTIEVLWTVCNSTMCYSGQGMYAFFGQIVTTDTIKVCYDALITEANSMEVCNRCDSLVFDQNTYTWVLFNMGNPVGLPGFVIEEDGVRWWNDVIYDMQGRELKEIPVGVMYIQGGKINLKRK